MAATLSAVLFFVQGALLLAGAGAIAPPVLSVVGAGSSAESPAFGSEATLSVDCCHDSELTCPPWVRVDRVGSSGETWTTNSPFTPIYPTFFQPCWGPTPFYFGGAEPSKPVKVVASGWSAEHNGSRLTPNSSNVSIHGSPLFVEQRFRLDVDDLGPGSVRLTVRPENQTARGGAAPSMTGVRFERMFVSSKPGVSPPMFKQNFGYYQASESGSIVLTFQEPGVYIYMGKVVYEGREGVSTAGAANGQPQPRPTALVVHGVDGELNNATWSVLPAGFAGLVHNVTALRTRRQLCIVISNVTVFHGGMMAIPLCTPDPAGGARHQPSFLSVVVPSYLVVHPENRQTVTMGRLESYLGLNVTLNSSTPLSGGLVRYTFHATGGRWGDDQVSASLYFTFPDGRVGITTDIMLMIHADLRDAEDVPLTRWQKMAAHLVRMPNVALPHRLVTSLTWAMGPAFLMDQGDVNQFLALYRRLGFNTVPLLQAERFLSNQSLFSNTAFNSNPGKGAVGYEAAPPYLWPGNRTSQIWRGDPSSNAADSAPLLFGPVFITDVSGGADFCKRAPDASQLPPGLLPAQAKLEMAKWQKAHEFYNATKSIDVAYDGIFTQLRTTRFCAEAKITQPDWIFMDDEQLGQGWESWMHNAAVSANAAERALPGESRIELAWRMASEMFSNWTSCLQSVAPNTRVGWFGREFPYGIFTDSGITPQLAGYDVQHYLRVFPREVRYQRLSQFATAKPRSDLGLSKPRHILPWLTSCTWGQMTAVDVLESTLHSFGGGATGFSFFYMPCISDPGMILALSTATALAGAHEDLLMDGHPMRTDALTSATGLRQWSGMQHGDEFWLVLSPGSFVGRYTAASLVQATMTITARQQQIEFTACDLVTGKSYPLGLGGAAAAIALSFELYATTVIHMAPANNSRACAKLPGDIWLPHSNAYP